jgi:probable F420-dependent oxidoreductase
MHDPRFGLFILPTDIASAQATAQRAERDGFYSVSHNDHFYSPFGTPESPQLECFTVLTAVAAVTETIRLAPAVAVASFRTPALLAKIATSVDLASNGRLICGLGAGWQGTEYGTHGYRFPPLGERLEQLDETIRILKAMWTEDVPAFNGKHFRIENAFNNPRSVQKPHPPIMLGGSGTGLLRLAAKHADILNIIPPTSNGKDFPNDPVATRKFDMPTMKSRIEKLHGMCREAGRDPAEIELGGLALVGLSTDPNDAGLREMAKNLGFPDYDTAQRAPVALLGTPDEVKRELAARLKDTGVTYYIVVPAGEESYDRFVGEVMPEFTS